MSFHSRVHNTGYTRFITQVTYKETFTCSKLTMETLELSLKFV